MQDKKSKFNVLFYCLIVVVALLFVFFVGFKLSLNSSLLSFAEESKICIEELETDFDLSNLRGVDCSSVLHTRSRSLSEFEIKYSNFSPTGIDNNFYRFTVSGDLTALTNEEILKNVFGISSFVVGNNYYINVSSSSENQNGYFFISNSSGVLYRIYEFHCYKTSTSLLFRALGTNLSDNGNVDIVLLNQSYSTNVDSASWKTNSINSMFYSCLGVGTPISNLNLFTTDYDLINNSSFYNALFVLAPINYQYDSVNNLIVFDKNLLFGTNGSFAITSITYNYGLINYPLSFSSASGYNSSSTNYDITNKTVSFGVLDSISNNIAFCINVSLYISGTSYNYITLPLLLNNMPQLSSPHINTSSNYLYWNAVPDANCYYIYYSEDNSNFDFFVSVYTNSYSAYLNGFYKIVAVDTNALYLNSDFSNIVEVDTYFNPISDYSTYNFYTLFSAIFDVSVYYLQSMLNFSIFGLNFYMLFKLIIVVCLTLIIVKFVNKKGS